jgi:hypothetical protein
LELHNRQHCSGDVSVSSDGSYIAAGSRDYKVYFFVSSKLVAQNAINVSVEIISQMKSKGFNVAEADFLLSQAEQSFKSSNYEQAESLAEQAKVKAEEIGRKATPAKTAIDEAQNLISQEKGKGFNVDEAEVMLEAAFKSFNTNDYFNAKELAIQARSLAIDIDQDGVPNSEDFAPTINNTYIYAGVFVFVLGLFPALKGAKWYLDKKRIERERFEKEKAEIIAMIEEVVKK